MPCTQIIRERKRINKSQKKKEKSEKSGSRIGGKGVTKFEAIRCIEGAKEFSDIIWGLVKKIETPEELVKELLEEIPEEGLQTLKSIAKKGNYPLSL